MSAAAYRWWVHVDADRQTAPSGEWAKAGPYKTSREAQEGAREYRRAGYLTSVVRDWLPGEREASR